MTRNVLIMGAAGRDFHNFNVVFRDDPGVRVVAFTAAQVPGIDQRVYAAELAGPRYPLGIPIFPESALPELIEELDVDDVVFAYSDVEHADVMHAASKVLAAGARFMLLGPDETMLTSRVPVIAVTGVRTGVGKSEVTRAVARALAVAGMRAVVMPHPMPYGDLHDARVKRFETLGDLDEADATIEEREEVEPLLRAGNIVYTGTDTKRVLEAAEQVADAIIWDGGNNDLPFVRPTVHIVVTDQFHGGDEATFHPGETNIRMADVIVINKLDLTGAQHTQTFEAALRALNPTAMIVKAASPVTVDRPEHIKGRRVLVIEDGAAITRGGLPYAAGAIAARDAGAAEILDPRPHAVGSLQDLYEQFAIGPVLPAMGYSPDQVAEMEKTLDAVDPDVVVVATPIDVRHLMAFSQEAVYVSYEIEEIGEPTLRDALGAILAPAPVA